jgi:hypothetical protein
VAALTVLHFDPNGVFRQTSFALQGENSSFAKPPFLTIVARFLLLKALTRIVHNILYALSLGNDSALQPTTSHRHGYQRCVVDPVRHVPLRKGLSRLFPDYKSPWEASKAFTVMDCCCVSAWMANVS